MNLHHHVDELVATAAASPSKRTQALGVRLRDLAKLVAGRLADERAAAVRTERENAERQAAEAEVARLEAALAEAQAKLVKPKRAYKRREPKVAAVAVAVEPEPTPTPEPEPLVSVPTAQQVTANYHATLAGIHDEKGWAEMEPEALAKRVATLRDLLAGGIPSSIPIVSTPDVLALYGVNPDEMDAACRMPTRVEIRPESVDKRYAVLAFFRGDMQVIVGFRFPKHPGVMAVYLGSMLANDSHHVEHTAGSGGSKTGTRGTTGLPTTPKQLINRLKGSGCTVELDPTHTDGITYRVIFRGEELGLIKSERTPRVQVQNDYNRLQRRMQAIARREEASA